MKNMMRILRDMLTVSLVVLFVASAAFAVRGLPERARRHPDTDRWLQQQTKHDWTEVALMEAEHYVTVLRIDILQSLKNDLDVIIKYGGQKGDYERLNRRVAEVLGGQPLTFRVPGGETFGWTRGLRMSRLGEQVGQALAKAQVREKKQATGLALVARGILDVAPDASDDQVLAGYFALERQYGPKACLFDNPVYCAYVLEMAAWARELLLGEGAAPPVQQSAVSPLRPVVAPDVAPFLSDADDASESIHLPGVVTPPLSPVLPPEGYEEVVSESTLSVPGSPLSPVIALPGAYPQYSHVPESEPLFGPEQPRVSSQEFEALLQQHMQQQATTPSPVPLQEGSTQMLEPAVVPPYVQPASPAWPPARVATPEQETLGFEELLLHYSNR